MEDVSTDYKENSGFFWGIQYKNCLLQVKPAGTKGWLKATNQ
jgi:hypothetical protein